MTSRAVSISRRAALGLALTTALTSCTARSGSGAAGSGAGPGLAKVFVGLIPVVEVAPVYLGVRRGIFRDHGLDVALQQFPGGAAIVPSVIAGRTQFGFSNVVSLLEGRDKGVPLISVAGAGSSTGDTLRDVAAVLVKENSPIFSARDLVGKTVAINSWNNIGDTMIKMAVRKDGGDDWKVRFVTMPFPEMPSQLAAGTVDAVWTAEPFRSLILHSGGRALPVDFTALYPKVQVVQYFTTEQLQRNNPALVAAFVNAVKESMTYSMAHLDEVHQILGTYTKITPADAARIVLPVWSPALDVRSTTAVGEAAYTFGTLFRPPDVAGLLGLR